LIAWQGIITKLSSLSIADLDSKSPPRVGVVGDMNSPVTPLPPSALSPLPLSSPNSNTIEISGMNGKDLSNSSMSLSSSMSDSQLMMDNVNHPPNGNGNGHLNDSSSAPTTPIPGSTTSASLTRSLSHPSTAHSYSNGNGYGNGHVMAMEPDMPDIVRALAEIEVNYSQLVTHTHHSSFPSIVLHLL
jgi:hypothetical protein